MPKLIHDIKLTKQDPLYIEGARLYLRSFELSDVNKNYLSWMKDPEVIKFLIGRRETYTLESLKRYVQALRGDKQFKFFAIVDMATNEHIGNVKLGPIDDSNRVSYVGLLIGNKNYWGSGCATEAVGLVSRFAFERLKLNKLMAGCTVSNRGAIKAFQKCGYLQEGLFRKMGLFGASYVDAVHLGLLAEDFGKLSGNVSESVAGIAKRKRKKKVNLKTFGVA